MAYSEGNEHMDCWDRRLMKKVNRKSTEKTCQMDLRKVRGERSASPPSFPPNHFHFPVENKNQ